MDHAGFYLFNEIYTAEIIIIIIIINLFLKSFSHQR